MLKPLPLARHFFLQVFINLSFQFARSHQIDCSKQNEAETKHIIPVKLPKNKLKEVLNIALKAHKIIKCRGISRSDFKFYNNKFYLLEINTQPGMTKLSLVPEIAAHQGISFINLIKWILKDAAKKK